MLSPDPAADVVAALVRARMAAEGHMEAADTAGFPWGEETITEILLAAAYPEAVSVLFNKRQEGRHGADWLWWWIDDLGEAFGLLIQAKRLHPDWSVDFGYREGKQMMLLRDAAIALGVHDAYVLYLGPRTFRLRMPSSSSQLSAVLRRYNAGVSAVPGWIVRSFTHHPGPVVDTSGVLSRSIPLEYLAFQDTGLSDWASVNASTLSPELRKFLTQPQVGARLVARRIFDLVADRRSELFRAAIGQGGGPTTRHELLGAIPVDEAHGEESFVGSVLQGLRAQAPEYVLQALEREPVELPIDVPNVAGMTVIRLRSN